MNQEHESKVVERLDRLITLIEAQSELLAGFAKATISYQNVHYQELQLIFETQKVLITRLEILDVLLRMGFGLPSKEVTDIEKSTLESKDNDISK